MVKQQIIRLFIEKIQQYHSIGSSSSYESCMLIVSLETNSLKPS